MAFRVVEWLAAARSAAIGVPRSGPPRQTPDSTTYGYDHRVAAFDPDDQLDSDRAFRLVSNTFVTMFWRADLLIETLSWLTQHGYEVIEVDAGSCADTAALLDALSLALDFPDYFGRNLHAFNDCMRDVVAGDYGSDLSATGFVLALTNYDAFVRRDTKAAHAVVDILADQCRNGALIGHRMMCLVQSDDPKLRLPPVGATPVLWNDAEWLDARRGGSQPAG